MLEATKPWPTILHEMAVSDFPRFVYSGGDSFAQLAIDWPGLPRGAPVSQADRHRTKLMVYGVIYGMGTAKMASDLGAKRGSAG